MTEDAAKAIFLPFRPRLLRDSSNFLGAHKSEAQDMVEDTFLAAFPRLGSYQGPIPMYIWLRQLCLRLCYARLRDRANVLTCLEEELADYARQANLKASASENLQLKSQQQRELLRELIKRLSPLNRQMIELRNLHGMTYAHIAYTLGISLPALTARLLAARTELRERMRSRPESSPPGKMPVAA